MVSEPELLLRAMSRSLILLHLGSVIMSMVCVGTGVIGIMHVEIQEIQGEDLFPASSVVIDFVDSTREALSSLKCEWGTRC